MLNISEQSQGRLSAIRQHFCLSDKPRNKGHTALLRALQEGHFEIADILLTHPEIDMLKGYKMNDNDTRKLIFGHDNVTQDEEFLLTALMGDSSNVQKQLKDKGITEDFSDKRGMTALIWASKYGHNEVVKLLLNSSRVDINKKRKSDGATALILASYNGHEDVVEILLAQSEIETAIRTSPEGNSALMTASIRGHDNVLQLLVATNKVDVNDVNIHGESPLFISSQMGNFKAVLILLGNQAIDVNKATGDRVSPLMASAKEGHYSIIEILLAHPNIDVTYANFEGETALFIFIKSNQDRDHTKLQHLVNLFLRCPSVEIHHLDGKGNHASHYAALRGFSNLTLSFEPKNYANIKKSGHTCCSTNVNDGLQIASKQGDIKMVKTFLLCPQVDLNDGYKFGITPLYMATDNNETEVVKALLDDPRINVNKVVNSENVLIKAVEMKNSIILDLLLKHSNVDVNQINHRNKRTALISAATLGFADIVENLLKHPQTFVNTLDSQSESALKKAEDGQHYEVYELLIRCPKTKIPGDVDGYIINNIVNLGNLEGVGITKPLSLMKDQECHH